MDDDERNRGHCDLYPFGNDGRMFVDASMFRRMEYYKGKFYCFVFTGGLYIFDRNGRFQKLIPIGPCTWRIKCL